MKSCKILPELFAWKDYRHLCVITSSLSKGETMKVALRVFLSLGLFVGLQETAWGSESLSCRGEAQLAAWEAAKDYAELMGAAGPSVSTMRTEARKGSDGTTYKISFEVPHKNIYTLISYYVPTRRSKIRRTCKIETVRFVQQASATEL
jgi:hypothetical protein